MSLERELQWLLFRRGKLEINLERKETQPSVRASVETPGKILATVSYATTEMLELSNRPESLSHWIEGTIKTLRETKL